MGFKILSFRGYEIAWERVGNFMGLETQPEYIPFFDCFCHNIAPSVSWRHQNAGWCKRVKLNSMHKDDGVPLGSAKQEENSIFIVQGWGFSPALFVAVYIPQEWRKVAVCIPHFFPCRTLFSHT